MWKASVKNNHINDLSTENDSRKKSNEAVQASGQNEIFHTDKDVSGSQQEEPVEINDTNEDSETTIYIPSDVNSQKRLLNHFDLCQSLPEESESVETNLDDSQLDSSLSNRETPSTFSKGKEKKFYYFGETPDLDIIEKVEEIKTNDENI